MRWPHRAAVFAAASLLVVSGVAWAAGMNVTSQRLTAGTLPAPAFHPTGVAVTRFANGGASPDQKDVITMTFNRAVSAISVCAITPDTQLSGFTVTLADGGAGNDTLSVTAGPLTCPAPRVGTVDLGTGGYLSTGTATFTGSSLSVITNPPSLQITLGGKPSRNLVDVKTTTVVRFVPDSALVDLLGSRVRGTAASSVQF